MMGWVEGSASRRQGRDGVAKQSCGSLGPANRRPASTVINHVSTAAQRGSPSRAPPVPPLQVRERKPAELGDELVEQICLHTGVVRLLSPAEH
jgi:hypothetical protein